MVVGFWGGVERVVLTGQGPDDVGVNMLAVVCMRVSANALLVSRAAPRASPIIRLTPALPGVGVLKLSSSLLPWPICPEKAGVRPKSGSSEMACAPRIKWRR